MGTGVTSEVRTIEVEAHPIVPITALTLDTPINISQTVGNITAVTFTAQTTPAEYVDMDTVEWYLDGVKQSTTGVAFTFMPEDKVGTYTVYAKVKDKDIVSDTKTVSVVLRIPQDDVFSLNEPFLTSEYKAGDKVITNSNSVTSHRYSVASGMVAADPKDENNLVAAVQ